MQDEYRREEIDWQPIDIISNDQICELIDRPINGIFTLLENECQKNVYFREELLIQNLNLYCCKDLHFTEIVNPVHVSSSCSGDVNLRFMSNCLPYRRLSAGDASNLMPQLCFAIKHYVGTVCFTQKISSYIFIIYRFYIGCIQC